MPINDPTGKETRSELADWIELSSIVAPAGSTGSAELRRLIHREDDSEHRVIVEEETGEALEEETLESGPSAVEDAVVQELEFRSSILGNAYPFEIHSAYGTWRVVYRGGEADGREAYLACLFISCMRDRRISEAAAKAQVGVDPARVFQTLASLAARRYLGEGISFGWPRPDGTSFRDALANFVAQLGVGKERDVPFPSSNRHEKDEGIDVIAWRSFPDGRPGHLLLLGQVASGGNWRGKPVNSEIGSFLDWFNTRPVEHSVGAMFIPFPQHHDLTPTGDTDWDEAVIDFCRRNEIKFGLMFDRLRITEMSKPAPILIDVDVWNAGVIRLAREAR
jgi:hypothetical protein